MSPFLLSSFFFSLSFFLFVFCLSLVLRILALFCTCVCACVRLTDKQSMNGFIEEENFEIRIAQASTEDPRDRDCTGAEAIIIRRRFPSRSPGGGSVESWYRRREGWWGGGGIEMKYQYQLGSRESWKRK